MTWNVTFTGKAAKQARKLPQREQQTLVRLLRDLQLSGAVQPKWQNYSRLGKGEHHCHLSYRWVACWRERNNAMEIIEIHYVGSRENAPY